MLVILFFHLSRCRFESRFIQIALHEWKRLTKGRGEEQYHWMNHRFGPTLLSNDMMFQIFWWMKMRLLHSHGIVALKFFFDDINNSKNGVSYSFFSYFTALEIFNVIKWRSTIKKYKSDGAVQCFFRFKFAMVDKFCQMNKSKGYWNWWK